MKIKPNNNISNGMCIGVRKTVDMRRSNIRCSFCVDTILGRVPKKTPTLLLVDPFYVLTRLNDH